MSPSIFVLIIAVLLFLASLLPDPVEVQRKEFEKQQSKRAEDRARVEAWREEWLKELHSKSKK